MADPVNGNNVVQAKLAPEGCHAGMSWMGPFAKTNAQRCKEAVPELRIECKTINYGDDKPFYTEYCRIIDGQGKK